jgi:hypothetical protein
MRLSVDCHPGESFFRNGCADRTEKRNSVAGRRPDRFQEISIEELL